MASDEQQAYQRASVFYPQYHSFPIDRSTAPSPFRIDEGFSEEEAHNVPDVTAFSSDQMDIQRTGNTSLDSHSLRTWLLGQPVNLRAALARDLLASVPTSVLSSLVNEANARLHFDPIRCLPQEIVSYIFEFLDPLALLNASLVSQLWTSHATEPRLWRRLFALEGWSYNSDNIRALEDSAANQPKQPQTSPLADEEMQDADELDDSDVDVVAPFAQDTPILSFPHSPVTDQQYLQPNWKYLYKQRRKLEQNWTEGRFAPFRLPHPNYPADAHRQCVYTLQFSPKYVASGSRDKSVRIWDLSTHRLKMPPLLGHDGSVLCVQFDERPQHDIVVSGSSDADVIIWRFSTGGMIKRLRKAHAESVLNIRFDHRYLVTCSKDKTIKLWNRRELLPTDADYPQKNQSPNATFPQYIVDVKELLNKPKPPVTTPLMPYTLLMTLNEHNAAVNAVQIHGDEIVSASGDRKIMLWHIPSGRLIRTFIGHAKGIACVQYDGRRIISGSSDNSVRIFDRETAAEVAILEGHNDLVRTVQADFSDIAGNELLLEAQAKENDKRILEQKQMELDGHKSPSSASSRRDPQAPPFVFGAKLPPGGGGNRWSKIISGSYDETVIIWRKNKDGQWVSVKELRQEDAMRATAPAGQPPEASTYNIAINNGTTRLTGVANRLTFSLSSPLTHIVQRAKELGMPPELTTQESLTWIRRNLLMGRPVRGGSIQFFRFLRSTPIDPNVPANDSTGSSSQTLSATLPGPLPAHLHPDHPHFQYQTAAAHAGGNPVSSVSTVFHHIARQLVDPHIQQYFQEHLERALRTTIEGEMRQSTANSVAAASTTAQPSSSTDREAEVDRVLALLENPEIPYAQAIAEIERMNKLRLELTSRPPYQSSPPSNDANNTSTTLAATIAQTLSTNNQSTSAPQQAQGPPTTAQPANPGQAGPQQPQQQQQQQQAQHGPHQLNAQSGFSRVFKLQFDSRRIICCSQQPVIVGWDFANGDKAIEEASQFFDGPP